MRNRTTSIENRAPTEHADYDRRVIDEAPDPHIAGPAAPAEITTRLSPTGRVEAFSDGVMAIAMTLLVLTVVPAPTAEQDR